jgi:hypothetical protein
MSGPAALVLVASLSSQAASDGGGQFFRNFWLDLPANSFRVNSPDTATGQFRDRWEAKQTGLMILPVGDNLKDVSGAELYLELWGGHPGNINKRFTLNGKSTYPLPEVGAAEGHCTYSYPAVPLKLDELRSGPNAIQFTCDKGGTFWGHYIVRAACIRLALKGAHPSITKAGLGGFVATVTTKPGFATAQRGSALAEPGDGETLRLSLACPDAMRSKMASVEYWGRYNGYDENGNRQSNDWHGYTKGTKPTGIIALADKAPFEAVWDLTMVPDQKGMSVRAVVHFKDAADVTYVTAPADGLATPERKARVRLIYVDKMPDHFWSRANDKKTARLILDADPAEIERAQLHIVVWDGGRGNVANPLSLNGQGLPTPDWGGRHDLIYSAIDLKPSLLKKGDDTVLLQSDTAEHGIECCLPGPGRAGGAVRRALAN